LHGWLPISNGFSEQRISFLTNVVGHLDERRRARLKPPPGIFFVASMPGLLPLAISLVAWSSTSDGPFGISRR
jgi:hypothetical protein